MRLFIQHVSIRAEGRDEHTGIATQIVGWLYGHFDGLQALRVLQKELDHLREFGLHPQLGDVGFGLRWDDHGNGLV
jgi:hypothetical protein